MNISCLGAMFMVGGMLKWPPTMNVAPKNKMLIFRLCLISDDRPSNLSCKSHQKCEKMATKSFFCTFGNFHCSEDLVTYQKLKVIQKQAFHILVQCSCLGVCWTDPQPWTSHQKIRCSFLDYVWLLMISRVIPATKVAKNVKIMAAKSFYYISGNFHCSGDSANHQKLKIIQKWDFHFLVQHPWLRVCWNAPQPWMSHQKIKCSFLDYVWLLMIGWVIWATKVTKNVKIMAAKSFCCIFGNFHCSDVSADHQKLYISFHQFWS